MGSLLSKASEDSRPTSTRDLGETGNVETDKRVFDDGVGKKTILPFFFTEPCEEVVKLIQVVLLSSSSALQHATKFV